jgi:hypothetical protein
MDADRERRRKEKLEIRKWKLERQKEETGTIAEGTKSGKVALKRAPTRTKNWGDYSDEMLQSRSDV